MKCAQLRCVKLHANKGCLLRSEVYEDSDIY